MSEGEVKMECESCAGTGTAVAGIEVTRLIPCPECDGLGHHYHEEETKQYKTYDHSTGDIVCYMCGIKARAEAKDRCIACGYDGS